MKLYCHIFYIDILYFEWLTPPKYFLIRQDDSFCLKLILNVFIKPTTGPDI